MAIRSQDYHFPDSPIEESRLNFDTTTTWSNWRDRENNNFLDDNDTDNYLLTGSRKSHGLSNDLKKRENAYNKWKNDNNILSINDRRNKSKESTDTWSNWREEEEDDIYNDGDISQPVTNRRKSENISWSNWREKEKMESQQQDKGMTSSKSWSNWRERENALNFGEDSSSSVISENTTTNVEKPKDVQKPRQWQNWREMEAKNENSKKHATETIIEKDEENEAADSIDSQSYITDNPQADKISLSYDNSTLLDNLKSDKIDLSNDDSSFFTTTTSQDVDDTIAIQKEPMMTSETKRLQDEPMVIPEIKQEEPTIAASIKQLQIYDDIDSIEPDTSEKTDPDNELSSNNEDTSIDDSNLKEQESLLIERGGQFELIGNKDMEAHESNTHISEITEDDQKASLKDTIAQILNRPIASAKDSTRLSKELKNTSNPSSPVPMRKKIIRPRTAPATLRRNNEYDYIKSEYGLTDRQKELLARKKKLQAELEAERKLKEEEAKKQAREDAEGAFRAWLQAKREQAIERKLLENTMDPEEVKRAKLEQVQRCKDAYDAWLSTKAEKLKENRILEEKQQQEEEAYKIEHSRRQCERAFSL